MKLKGANAIYNYDTPGHGGGYDPRTPNANKIQV